MTTYYRDERTAKRLPPLRPVVSQDVEEGYRLVRPDGALSAVVVHVQWLDNHPAGPDTHVMLSFEDGSNVEFPFDLALTMVWHDEQRPVTDAALAAAAATRWGRPTAPWRP